MMPCVSSQVVEISNQTNFYLSFAFNCQEVDEVTTEVVMETEVIWDTTVVTVKGMIDTTTEEIDTE